MARKSKLRTALAGLWMVLTPCVASQAAPADPPREPAAAETARFLAGNLARVRGFLDEASGPGALDDYYFVLIGDIQNSPRNLSHDVFEAIAGDIRRAVDPKTGERFYGRIQFVILLGDMVEEGTGRRQWEALARAFAGRDPDGRPYPNIAALVADKPIFPALGNHEILSFRFYPQNRYKDLFDSPRGVANFRKFFGWDRWIADPHILYPVPADLATDAFRDVLGKLTDPADRQALTENYGFKDDGRYHLKFYDHPSLDAAK
ncbi:MAG TPA: metallophosphoesterase, partial [Burkholderiales bacterium]|nr:metallophosphoesterase [Burkholderiales bacterium]